MVLLPMRRKVLPAGKLTFVGLKLIDLFGFLDLSTSDAVFLVRLQAWLPDLACGDLVLHIR